MLKLLWIASILFMMYLVIGIGFGLSATWYAGERVTLKELLKFSLLWVKFFIGR